MLRKKQQETTSERSLAAVLGLMYALRVERRHMIGPGCFVGDAGERIGIGYLAPLAARLCCG
jgi:hypothetical protein